MKEILEHSKKGYGSDFLYQPDSKSLKINSFGN